MNQNFIWLKWATVCTPISSGGLGLRKVKLFELGFVWEVAMEIWDAEGCPLEASDKGEIWLWVGWLVY